MKINTSDNNDQFKFNAAISRKLNGISDKDKAGNLNKNDKSLHLRNIKGNGNAVIVTISKEGRRRAEESCQDVLNVSNDDEVLNDVVKKTDKEWVMPDCDFCYADDAMRIYDPEAFEQMCDRLKGLEEEEYDKEYMRSWVNWFIDNYKVYDSYHRARFGTSMNMGTNSSYKEPMFNMNDFAYNTKIGDFGKQLRNCLMYENKHNVFMNSEEMLDYIDNSDKGYNNKVTTLLSDSYEKIKEYDEKGVEHGNIGFLIEGASIKEVYALNGDKIIRGTDIDDLFSNLSKIE